MFYREWCPRKYARSGNMLPVTALDIICKQANPGYASVYMFDEAAAKEIRESGTSQNFARFSVYADTVTVDIDGGDADLAKAEAILCEKQIGYTVDESGGKGYHIYLQQTELLGSIHLPFSHKMFVKSLGIPMDESLYQHGRIISLRGRIHEKTGRKKAFIKTVPGNKVVVPILEPEVPAFNFQAIGGLENLSAGIYKIHELLLVEPTPGNRHTRLWSVACNLAEAGISYEATCELLTRVNDNWINKKPQDEVLLAIQQAYKGLSHATRKEV
jgi:hypothetical protein